MNMRSYRIPLVITLAAVCGLSLAAELAQPRHPTREFMRQKLTYSQGVLEGITLEKYNLVVSNAAMLRKMNMTNAFVIVRNPKYLESIISFHSSVNDLIAAAVEKNLENTTEAYTKVARKCVACHQQFRRE